VEEHALAHELVAALISEALNEGGFVQMLAIFSEARRLEIGSALKNLVRKLGMVDSQENCWRLFANNVQRHLHIVVMASTTGACFSLKQYATN
jgi:hypothetical protein